MTCVYQVAELAYLTVFCCFSLFAFYCVIAVGMENWCPHYWNHICMYGVNGYAAHFNTISPSNGLIRPLFLRHVEQLVVLSVQSEKLAQHQMNPRPP